MTYSPFLIIHILGGMVGVFTGFAALFVRKGSRLHRRYGIVFVIAMLVMAASGALVAFAHSQPTNVLAGVFTFYLVSTAWLTVRRREKETGRIELALLLIVFAAGISGLILGATATRRAAPLYFIFGIAALLSASGDVRMLIRGGVAGVQRLRRHLWRMCVGLFIAAGSFFLGVAGDPVMRRTGLRARLFTPEVRATHLPELPVLLIIVLMVFWLVRVRSTNAYKKAER